MPWLVTRAPANSMLANVVKVSKTLPVTARRRRTRRRGDPVVLLRRFRALNRSGAVPACPLDCLVWVIECS